MTTTNPANSTSAGREGQQDLVIDEYGFIVTQTQLARRPQGDAPRSDRIYLDKWLKMVANFERYRTRKGKKLKRRVRKGVPPRLRGVVWQQLTDSTRLKNDRDQRPYSYYKGQSIDGELSEVIERDLGRTFPTHCYFRDEDSPGQIALRKVLTAYAAYNDRVGYCQGMGFVTATLILHMSDEEAFWVLVQMMRKYSMGELYTPGFPLLQEKFYQLKQLMKRHLPKLHGHLEREGVDMSFFASEWFLTLFVYQFPTPLLLRVWDIFLSEGWKIVFRVAISLMDWEEHRLLTLGFESLLPALKSLHEGKTADDVIARALKVKIRRNDLSRLKSAYEGEQRAASTGSPPAPSPAPPSGGK